MNCNLSKKIKFIKNHEYMKHLDMPGSQSQGGCFQICDFSEARHSLLLLLVKPLPAPSLALVASSGGPASGQAATTPHSLSHLPRAQQTTNRTRLAKKELLAYPEMALKEWFRTERSVKKRLAGPGSVWKVQRGRREAAERGKVNVCGYVVPKHQAPLGSTQYQ